MTTTSSDTETQPRPTAHRIASVITEAFAPAVLAGLLPLVIALHASTNLLAGLGWAALAVFFSAVIPYGIIWLGVRRGQLTDHHIGVREQRRKPLLLGLVSVLVGLALLLVLGAPRPLIAMIVVIFGVVLILAVVNMFWKLSGHTAVASGSATVLVIAFGPALLAAFVIVVAVGWSRVQLRAHTPTQVVTGFIAGILIAAPTYLLVA
ncbi:phosphatase PAP2 family protein [Micromonospora sp. NPDC003197]